VPPYFILRCVEGLSGVEGITLGNLFCALSAAGWAGPEKSLLLPF
jgi:hypothetical protein